MRKTLAAVLLLAGCAGQPAPAGGEHPTIVSLNPCADAILAEVTVPGQLLAISHYSHDPAATSMLPQDAARFGSTGGTVEEVLALDPDVVVADTFLAPATRHALESAGVDVVTIGIATSLQQSYAQIREVAELSAEPARGDALAAEIGLAWAEYADDGPRIPVLLWQQGGIVPGRESLAAEMLESTGFTLHSAARGLGQGAYLPLEQVLADPPALILAAGDERMLTHPVLRQLDGVRYETFDSTLLFCGGPTIPRALGRLGAIRATIR